MVYITGDCHGKFEKLSFKRFPEQREMTKDDFVIICGDFGIWHDTNEERYWIKWLKGRPFTILFVDGNHENFDRLKTEFPAVDFHGGKAHKIAENIYHLMRGYVFDLCGKKLFAFGGASSHDIEDGILRREDYASMQDLIHDYRKRVSMGQAIRVDRISWWQEELPTKYEMQRGRDNLKKHNFEVDFVISHCLPSSVVTYLYGGHQEPDVLTSYFERLLQKELQFNKWYAGHYHREESILGKFEILYNEIVRVL